MKKTSVSGPGARKGPRQRMNRAFPKRQCLQFALLMNFIIYNVPTPAKKVTTYREHYGILSQCVCA